jgi:hypothetical protein
MFERLADMGMKGAGRLIHLTPREIDREVRAFAARRARDAENLAAHAWLVGKYVALGVNAPARYPARPPKLHARARTMTAAEMKRALLSAAGRGDDNDAGGA